MSNSRFTALRHRVALLTQAVRCRYPLPAALAGLSFVGLAEVGKRATSTRKRRMSLLSLAAMMVLVGPAAAQVDCSNGVLGFLSNLHSLVTQSAGLIIVSMVIAAGVLKMIPGRGTNSIGNALIGGVLVGIVFLVAGPALVDIAGQSTSVPMTPQCGGGGSG